MQYAEMYISPRLFECLVEHISDSELLRRLDECSIWQDIEREQVIVVRDLSEFTMLGLFGCHPQLSFSISSASGALLAEHLLHQLFPVQGLDKLLT